MVKFEMHTPPDEAAPGGTCNGDADRPRAVLRMSGEQSLATVQEYGRIAVVHCLDLQHRAWRHIIEKHASLDFGLDDVAIYFIAEVGVRSED